MEEKYPPNYRYNKKLLKMLADLFSETGMHEFVVKILNGGRMKIKVFVN